METLEGARLVLGVAGEDVAYTPARPLERITCHDVLQAMRAGYGQEPETCNGPAHAEVYGEFNRIEEAERQAAAGVTMLALANRAGKSQLTDGQLGNG
jgi:hypothetical protein